MSEIVTEAGYQKQCGTSRALYAHGDLYVIRNLLGGLFGGRCRFGIRRIFGACAESMDRRHGVVLGGYRRIEGGQQHPAERSELE